MIEALVVVAAVFAILAFAGAAWAVIQVEAMKRSTHSVQFVDPWKQELDKEFGEAPRAGEFDTITPERKDKMRAAQAKAYDEAEMPDADEESA